MVPLKREFWPFSSKTTPHRLKYLMIRALTSLSRRLIFTRGSKTLSIPGSSLLFTLSMIASRSSFRWSSSRSAGELGSDPNLDSLSIAIGVCFPAIIVGVYFWRKDAHTNSYTIGNCARTILSTIATLPINRKLPPIPRQPPRSGLRGCACCDRDKQCRSTVVLRVLCVVVSATALHLSDLCESVLTIYCLICEGWTQSRLTGASPVAP